LPSLFVVSDSTAFSNGQNQLGWGDPLAKFFDPEKINVLNRARPGRSTRSFRSEGLWSRALAEMKAGDFVLIQFGHNDADKLAEGRCRGVLPGVGEETKEVVMPDGTCEIVRTYGWYLRQFIAETKAKGATPILLSLTAKNIWENGRLQRKQSEYGNWAAQVAQASGADFIDLTSIIADRYDELGHERVQPLFCSASDNVHTSPAGAELNAACVAAGLKQITNSPFTNFLLP
jgi:lysophospholipase L1-like esterase